MGGREGGREGERGEGTEGYTGRREEGRGRLLAPHLTLSLLVLQRTVQENDTRVLDPSSHLGMSDVFVQHHTL